MKEIKDEWYRVTYNEQSATVSFEGSLLLAGSQAYKPILEMLLEAVNEHREGKLTINIRRLESLNSSGVSMMTKLAMYVYNNQDIVELHFLGSMHVEWHSILMKNLSRLMPSLHVNML